MMNEKTLEHTIAAIAAPLAASLGLAVWGVETGFGKRAIIRIFVEGETGVDIDACAELSRLIGITLDVEGVIEVAYVLEVSSPGLERVFFTPSQLARYVNKTVAVTLHAPAPEIPGRKRLVGTLAAAAEDSFTLLVADTPEGEVTVTFTWDDVKKANLVHFMPQPDPAPRGGKRKSA